MANALAQETSPYLQQHADNPVNWLPWSKQALDLAKKEGKPILLSIGYSACHWCHVMAHESFENENTAQMMNESFVNIKVDREERPDIDKIYQTAHQLMANRPGGWPLTMFLSPDDQLPFYGGTYFPHTARYGMISFSDLLKRITDVYQDQPDQIRQHTESMQQALNNLAIQDNINQNPADIEALQKFDSQLLQIYDSENGGFGQAPKFPQPAMLKQAIRRASTKIEANELYQALDFSLRKMALGGIQDHLAGGFYRYSVDDYWMIPHFEKMLYDNGQLLCVFSMMFRLSEKPIYQQAVEGIVSWLKNEMQSGSGLFYAALDADSEGVEGKYYLWTPTQVQSLIDPDFYPLFAYKFGLDQAANFEGQWHLHAYYDDQAVAEKFNTSADSVRANQLDAQHLLLKLRNKRIKPGLDDKILTAWNALVIQGLATSARIFNQHEYYQMAHRCLSALRIECWDEQRLLALSQTSGKRLPAYLDDYAYLLQATLDCLVYQWNSEDLEFAITLAEQLLNYFEDKDHGGFYFTANDHEVLIQRPKSWQDEAIPNGNAIAAQAIYQLGLLVGSVEYTRAAEKALQSVAGNVNRNPLYASGFLGLLEDSLSPPCQVIVRGETEQLAHWRERLLTSLTASQVSYFIPIDARGLPQVLADKIPGATATAWICRGFSCDPPVKDLDLLLSQLS